MRIGSPWPRPPGSFATSSAIEAAVGSQQHQLRGGLGEERLVEFVVGLNTRPDVSATWPFRVRTQPLSEITTVTGSRSTNDSSSAARSCSGASANTVAALAQRVFGLNRSRTLRTCSPTLAHCSVSDFRDRDNALQFVAELLVLGLDLELFQLAQTAQPHVEDGFGLQLGELERRHQRRLRLILGTDDANDLVDIEIAIR